MLFTLSLLLSGLVVSHGGVTFPWTCEAGTNSILTVTQDLKFSVQVSNALWLEDGDTALHTGGDPGTWVSVGGGTLHASTIEEVTSTDPILGPFTSLRITYSMAALGIPLFVTTHMCYKDSDLIEWRSEWPQGASRITSQGFQYTDAQFYNFNVSNHPVSHFPSFKLGPTAAVSSLGHAQWAGEFSWHLNNFGVSLEGYVGGQLGGPTVIHTPTFASNTKPMAGVLGTLGGHKDAIMGIVNDCNSSEWRWVFGPHGHFPSLPSGHTARLGFVVPSGGRYAVYPGDTGITAAVYEYGGVLRALDQTRRFAAEDDVGVSSLSMWTDNGGVYDGDFWDMPGNAGTGGVLFSKWKNALATQGVPAKSLQLDPYWFSRGEPGNKDWVPSLSVFGEGGWEATLACGWNPTLYTYMWAGHPSQLAPAFQPFSFLTSPIMDNFMHGPFTRVSGGDSAGFYALLMSRCVGWGCVGFEIDFLDFNYFSFEDAMQSPGAWDAFLGGLSQAGEAAGVPIQLCMPLPSDLLMSAALPGVSNIRASSDDDLEYAEEGRWRIGFTSLLLGSLDVRPFQDQIWTHSTYPTDFPIPYDKGYCQNATELGVAIGALSTGPLGLGDAVGATNATLVSFAVASNGVILKPSLPATPLDFWFSYPSALQKGRAEVWQAPSFIPLRGLGGRGGLERYHHKSPTIPTPVPGTFPNITSCPYLSLLLVDLPPPSPTSPSLLLYPKDTTPSLTYCGGSSMGYVVVPWSPGQETMAKRCAQGAPANDCVVGFEVGEGGSGLELTTAPPPHTANLKGGNHSFEVLSFAPFWGSVGGAGWVLLGEIGKFVRVSPVRFTSVSVQAGGGVDVVVEGASGETVSVTFLGPMGNAANGTAFPDVLKDFQVVVVDVVFGGGGGSTTITCKGIVGGGGGCSSPF